VCIAIPASIEAPPPRTLLRVTCVQDEESHMSDQYEENDDQQDDGNEDFKNLRAKAKKADTLERENATLKRENAFVKAGVPLDDPKMSYFVKGYDGDLDPQVIRDAAIEAGFMQAPQQQSDPAVEQAKAGQAAVVAAGSEARPGSDPNGVRYEMEQAYKEGGLQGLSAVTARHGVTFNPGY
jgi:hypothetical protein